VDPAIASSNAWELLRRSLSRNRLAHGLLFLGDDIDLLESGAEALAQTLNCRAPKERSEEGRPMAPCGTCPNCVRIAARNHADVTWIRPENRSRQISADQTREVVRTITLKPMEAAHKIAIFVGADRMHTTAANIFLKTLEEPPAGSVLILLSTEPGRLLDTILSRCQRVSFGVSPFRVGPEVEAWVGEFARLAAEGTAGVMARYQLLGTLLNSLGAARESIEERLTAASPISRYADATPDQQERWTDELAAAIEAEYRRLRGEYLGGLHAWLRDVWLAASGAGAATPMFPAFNPASTVVAARLRPAEALANIEAWEGTQRLLHTNVQEALALEVGLLRLKL
jgi:DNA polymerase-3 subunit delta'